MASVALSSSSILTDINSQKLAKIYDLLYICIRNLHSYNNMTQYISYDDNANMLAINYSKTIELLTILIDFTSENTNFFCWMRHIQQISICAVEWGSTDRECLKLRYPTFY